MAQNYNNLTNDDVQETDRSVNFMVQPQMENQQNNENQNNINDNVQQKKQKKTEIYEDEIYYSDQDFNCYMNTAVCCGKWAGCLATWIPCCCCFCPYPYVTVRQYEVGILERFGQYRKVLEAGFHKINPFTEKIRKINIRTQIIDIPRQSILTKDNLTVWIDAVVYYRIVDPKKTRYRLNQVQHSIVEITTSALRTVCGENKLQQILEERERVSEEISIYLFEHIKDWGILIEQVFIKDMAIDVRLQEAMSAAAKMRRIGESKVISARADVESAVLYREAADTLDSKAAMQIRYLETVQQLSINQNQKIVFIPLNNDEFKDEQDILQLDKKAQDLHGIQRGQPIDAQKIIEQLHNKPIVLDDALPLIVQQAQEQEQQQQ